MAAVRAALQTATVTQTVTCLKIAAAMFQVTVKSKVLANWVQLVLYNNIIITIEFTEYIMITNTNYIHRIDITETRSVYRLQTPVSGLKNATSLDYHYR